MPKKNQKPSTQWDEIVKQTLDIELKAQKDLKELKDKSIPESVHRTIQSIKQKYGYQPYLFNDEV
jgi:KaiC/GvpD/RAD55 family RecA-like ATPase